jgi:hypothetical protein
MLYKLKIAVQLLAFCAITHRPQDEQSTVFENKEQDDE